MPGWDLFRLIDFDFENDFESAQGHKMIGRKREVRFLNDRLIVTSPYCLSNLKSSDDNQTALCSRLIILLTTTYR